MLLDEPEKKPVLAGLSQRERQLIDRFIGQGQHVIRAEDLMQTGEFKNPNLILSRLYKKGWVQRLKSGVYRIVPLGSDSADPIPEDAWVIATELFAPCYIGGWTAAEHWDLTEQLYNTIMVFSAKKQRASAKKAAGLRFRIRFLPETHIFGTQRIWAGNQSIQVADIHRTFIDILADPSTGGGGRAMLDIVQAYTEKKEVDPDRLWQYAERLNSSVAFKRLGFIAEHILKLSDNYLDKIQSHCKTGIVLLDPKGPKAGPIHTRWRLRVNIPLNQLS